MVRFCQKCKGLVIPKKIEGEQEGKIVSKIQSICIRCNTLYEVDEKDNYRFTKKIDHSRGSTVSIDNTNQEYEVKEFYKEYEIERPEEDED